MHVRADIHSQDHNCILYKLYLAKLPAKTLHFIDNTKLSHLESQLAYDLTFALTKHFELYF